MGEIFPIVLVLFVVVIVGFVLAWKSNKLKSSNEQDTVTRFKLTFSRAKGKEIAEKMVAACDGNEADPVVEWYEEGAGRLIRFKNQVTGTPDGTMEKVNTTFDKLQIGDRFVVLTISVECLPRLMEI